MARTPRAEVFDPAEVAIVHVIQRCVRRCFLLGVDPETGHNHDHRRAWLERRMRRFAACFGIDLLCFSILSNHFHLVLRSRPDVVASWSDDEVARRWLMICPRRKDRDGNPAEPTEAELNLIRRHPRRLAEIRRRLSDVSWWMRLLCQPLAAMANREGRQTGRFWQGRYRAVRLCDEAAVLACAAYVDLNPIRAALAETLEGGDFTSIQRRIESLSSEEHAPDAKAPDRFLAPIEIDERRDPTGPAASNTPYRASDKGFLSMSTLEYLRLLDWTARQDVSGKAGVAADVPDVLTRLGLAAPQWLGLVRDFDRLFALVAGLPATITQQRGRLSQRSFHQRRRFRELMAVEGGQAA